MTPDEIKAILSNKKITQGDLHRRWGIPRCTVNMLVNRKFKSDRLEKKLARALGVKVETLRARETN